MNSQTDTDTKMDDYEAIKHKSSIYKRIIKKKLNNSKTRKYCQENIGHWKKINAVKRDKQNGNRRYRQQCKNKDIIEYPHKEKTDLKYNYEACPYTLFANKHKISYKKACEILDEPEFSRSNLFKFTEFMDMYKDCKKVEFSEYLYTTEDLTRNIEISNNQTVFAKISIFYKSKIKLIDHFQSKNKTLFLVLEINDKRLLTTFKLTKFLTDIKKAEDFLYNTYCVLIPHHEGDDLAYLTFRNWRY